MTIITETQIYKHGQSKPFDNSHKSHFVWSNSGLLAYTLNNNHISIYHTDQPSLIFNYSLTAIATSKLHATIKPNLFLFDGQTRTQHDVFHAQTEPGKNSKNPNLAQNYNACYNHEYEMNQLHKLEKLQTEQNSSNAQTKNTIEFLPLPKVELVTSLEFKRHGLIDILLIGTNFSNVYLVCPKNGSISFLEVIDKQNFSSFLNENLSKKCFVPEKYSYSQHSKTVADQQTEYEHGRSHGEPRSKRSKMSPVESNHISSINSDFTDIKNYLSYLTNREENAVISCKYIENKERFSLELEPKDQYTEDKYSPAYPDYQINFDGQISEYQRPDSFYPLNFTGLL